MKLRKLSLLCHVALAIAGLVTSSIHAAELQNGGFETATSNQANYWSSTGNPAGIGGKVRGGNQGGYGWTTSYFAGNAYPTNSTFATTFETAAVRQNLTGTGSTFVAGATYTVTAKLFSAGSYAQAQNAMIMWSLCLTADGTPVASDHWFSEEFGPQSAANGGPIPDDHIITIAPGSNGLTDATVTFTATAAQAGKTIGVQLGGNTQGKYAGVTNIPTAAPYFGMMDTITLTSTAIPQLSSFSADKDVVDGEPVTLSWLINNPAAMSTLTLNDGTGAVNVLPLTSTEDGYGFTTVNPTANTTYTLTLDGTTTRQLTVLNGKVFAFTTSKRIALAPDYETTLSWDVRPVGATVTISDGTTTTDVTADTDPETGAGSRAFVVPAASTTYTINVNSGSATATRRVLRATTNNAAFFIDKAAYVAGEPTVVTWAGTGGNSASWIGIYQKNETPGGANEYSDQWNYLNGTQTTGGNHTSGTMNFTMPAGDYYAVLFVDGGYIVEQGPIPFTVMPPVVPEEPLRVLTIARTTDVVAGEQLTITWASQSGIEYDVYASDTLAGDPLVDWDKVGAAVPSAGDESTSFTEDLPEPTPAHRFYRVYEVEP